MGRNRAVGMGSMVRHNSIALGRIDSLRICILGNVPTVPARDPWGGVGGCSLFPFPFSVFTTRVHINDEDFLTPAFFMSSRPAPLCFLPQKSTLGPVDLFVPFWTFLLNPKTSVLT